MSGLKYYVLDSETCGLKAGYHEMTELSIIRYDDRVQLTKRIKCEYPDRADGRALEITGMTIADLMKGDAKEEVVEKFEKFINQDELTIEHRCIVAHNAPFDKRFCHALWASVGKTFPAICWLNTMDVAKKWALRTGIKPKNNQLGTLLKFANIKTVKGIHNAESDARNLYLYWKKSVEESGLNQVDFIKRYPHHLAEE